MVELGSHEMELGGKTYLAEIKARIFDLGVISLIIRIPFEDDVTYDEYLDMAIVSENMPEDEIHHYLDAVLETIRPACSNERVSDFDEDFVVQPSNHSSLLAVTYFFAEIISVYSANYRMLIYT